MLGLDKGGDQASGGYSAGDTKEYNGATYRFKGGSNTQDNWEKV